MIPTEHHVEVLAMNLWLGIFGVTALTVAWEQFAHDNPAKADALRSQAREMLGVAHAAAGAQSAPRHHASHSLGWLFG